MKNSLAHQKGLLAVCLGLLCASSAWSFTPSNQPPESTSVPGNVLMPLSVEFPTGLQVSYTNTDYVVTASYVGYFDNRKCYSYATTNEVFSPVAAVQATGACADATHWSGNVLNWVTMTNLDQFRSVMTGGTRDNFSSMNATHPGDTTGRTVLIRSFSDRNNYNPIKRIRTTTLGVPTAWRGTDKWVRSGGYGSKFVISNANNFANWDGTAQRSACSANALPGNAGTSACFNIRVEVCLAVAGIAREDNCQTRYSGVAKPEGLVQQYANSLRFAAFGYLNETGNDRSGGVLRSAMKSVGKLAATTSGVVVTNPNPEWNDTTGIMVFNPDPADATASGVSQSGLMNYLNKFGYAEGYKGNDPVSELFYAAQLYMRGHTPPAAYTNNATVGGIDGFPVITGSDLTRGNSRDPMINTCQKNFMLAIGDIYTHCDGNLPGSTRAGCTGGTPTDPDGLNVETLWDNLRGLEGMPDARDASGLNGWAGGSGNPTPYVAGLAHWANTNDIRSDLTGNQSISTYFVDVLERTNNVASVDLASRLRTQYWLAAKYGGFDTTRTGGSATNPNTLSTSWDLDANGVPDTWFAGSSPELMKAGLSAAFADIASKSSVNSAASAAVTSTRQTSNSQVIYASYNPQDWSGTVRACATTQTAAQCRDTPTWEASEWFKTTSPMTGITPLTATTRKIITSWRSATDFTRSPFQWADINTAQQDSLKTSATDTLGEDRLNYLRGDRSQEGIEFRRRHERLLGDVVNAGVGYLSGPGPALFGANFPGHAAYRLANKDRPAVVYAGSNDGMLHAFDARTTGTTQGKELFGYIPSAVYSKLNGVSALAFTHQYLVDSSPMVGDFQKNATTWGTMLVGGLGAGGRGYYALDLTNQASFSTMSESALSAIPMWEFTSVQDADLGYTFNEPSINPVSGANMQIAKIADATTATGVWRVIVGNGYGSTNQRAALFMLDANTGASTKLIAHAGPTNGLSTPTPIDTDRDGLVDTIYAGDLLGNMHKFQFSKLVAGNYVLATPSDASPAWRYLGKVYASGEPITTAPSVDRGLNGIGWIVSFGTGKLNETADYTNTTDARGFYSVLDDETFTPGQTVANVLSTELANITYTSSSLADGRATRTWTTPDLTGRKGWKMVFTGGEQVLSNSTLPPDTGVVLFATTKTSGDICVAGNTGFIMGVKLGTGASSTLKVDGVAIGGLAVDSNGINKVSNTYADPDKTQTVVCNQDDCKPKECTNPAGCDDDGTIKVDGSSAPRGRYSWREILTK